MPTPYCVQQPGLDPQQRGANDKEREEKGQGNRPKECVEQDSGG